MPVSHADSPRPAAGCGGGLIGAELGDALRQSRKPSGCAAEARSLCVARFCGTIPPKLLNNAIYEPRQGFLTGGGYGRGGFSLPPTG